MNAHQEITFHLSKDEVMIYEMLCREMDVPTDKYRTGRKVECPLFHAADLNVGFCVGGSKRVDVDSDSHFEDVTAWADLAEGLLRKCAASADAEGVKEDLHEMVDNDPRVIPEGVEEMTQREKDAVSQFWELHEASKRL